MNRTKLTGADRVKYQIHNEIAANLPKCATYSDLEKRLRQAGIIIQYKYRRGAEESPENIQGVSFEKGGITFKGSNIDRKFSHANLSKVMRANLDEWFKTYIEPEITPEKREAEQATTPVVPSPELPKPQTPKLTVPQVSEPPEAAEASAISGSVQPDSSEPPALRSKAVRPLHARPSPSKHKAAALQAVGTAAAATPFDDFSP